MLRIAVVEDSDVDSQTIEEHIDKFIKSTNIQIHTDVFNCGLDFLDAYKANYDIICMDIEMPHLDGIKTAESIRKIDEVVPLIFITNMAKYAINGYSVSALGYLLKPVAYTDFCIVIKKAISIVDNNARAIVIKTEGAIKRLNNADIAYIEVQNNTLYVKMSDKTVYQTRMTMTEIERMLGRESGFIRCNNCYLVNIRYVNDIYDNVVKVSGDNLSISRHRKRAFVDAVSDYFGQR
jgi:DNA-binding LytR/AlgR family response regulator